MNVHSLSDLSGGMPIQRWLVLGPFVVKTGGHFEREYLYERHRVLDIDYLEGDGGEANVQPAAGKAHGNIGLGPKTLAWTPYERAELQGMRIAGDLIYETVQRNCVIYAAAEIESDRDCPALLDAYHSGMKAWVNGDLVCDEPYGLTKGVRLTMPSKPLHLRKGRNTLLIKFRPGYIADGVNFEVRDVRVSPLEAGQSLPVSVGRVRALPLFTGTMNEPRQIIEAALVNASHVAEKVRLTVASPTLNSKDETGVLCEPGRTTVVRLGLHTPKRAAGKKVRATVTARLFGRVLEAPLEYEAAAPPPCDGTELVLSYFHFDTTYHEEQRVYAMGAFDIVRQYCRLLREDPNFRATLSEIDYLKPYFDMFPDDRDTLLKAFRENRANSDCMYNQPNEQTCGDEGLVRNFLYGQLFTGNVLGRRCAVYSPEDVFGHPNQLSQIARKSGCIGVMWGKFMHNFPNYFLHLALDGVALPQQRGRASWEDCMKMGLTVRNTSIDQTPPTDWHEHLLPRVKQAVAGEMPAEVRRQCEEEGARLPVTSRDMSLYHAATAMSRINLKIANRLGENLLLTAERFATMAALLGATYPEKALDKAWRQILCGQHHDSITGTHNEISYVDLMNAYREVLELGTDVLDGALDYLGKAINPASESAMPKSALPLTVYNPVAWERTDAVRATVKPGGMKSFAIQDHRGKNVPFEVVATECNKRGDLVSADVVFVARKLPSLGYRSYRIVPASKALPERKPVKGVCIENEFYRIEVDPERGGGMVSLYDKKAKREVMPKDARHVGNELAALDEVPERNETQHEFYTNGMAMFSGHRPAQVEVAKGPVSATVRCRYAMVERCGVTQEISLYKGVQRVEFRTVIEDYQGEDTLFCVTFPTNLKGAAPVFDERFGAVTRNDSRGYLDFRTHQYVMFSDCAVYAANKWMEYGVNALVKMGRNTYPLGMVGLIAPEDDTEAAEEVQRILIKKGVTCTPWHDVDEPTWGTYQYHMDEDRAFTRFRLSIGSRSRNKYTKKLLARQKAAVRKAFDKRLKRDGVAYLFVKDGELIDAVADKGWGPLPVLIVEAKGGKQLAEALEKMLAGFPATAVVKLPAEVDATGESHAADNYGVAMLNRGNYANSVEQAGTLCMMLAHTCRWYGAANSFANASAPGYLVPENKNHVFQYALYPHADGWREAATHRAGHEYNHPPVARMAKPVAKACLPAEQALVQVEPANVLLTALKPFGNPMAAFSRDGACDPAAGIMARVYETEGVDAEATLRFATGIRAAWQADLIEERGGDLAVHDGALSFYVAPGSIETVGFTPGKTQRRFGRKRLGAEAEPVQPVWVRSWEHDAESMPMGYHGMVCSLGRDVVEEEAGRVLRVKVNAVNDYTDAGVQGEAALVLAEGWRAQPETVAFDLAPLGRQVTEVRVTRPNAESAGQLKLRYDFDGQTFQDVLEVGAAFELELTAENLGDRIEVTVTNPTGEEVDGEVSVVTPIETWPDALTGGHGLIEIGPRTQAVRLAPGASKTYRFVVKSPKDGGLALPDSYWAAAKLMSNGRIQLTLCGSHPARRRQTSHTWLDSYRRRAEQYQQGER